VTTFIRILAICCVAALSAMTAVAQNDDPINPDRPGIADGSTTLRRGRVQIEAGVERDDASSGGVARRSLSTPALLRYGLTDALELRVEGTGYRRVTSDGATSAGWAPGSIGLKTHLLEEDAKQHRPSLGIITRLFVPSGSGEFRSRRATGDIRLAADLDITERWAVNPNIGVDFDYDDGRFTAALAALTVQYNFTPRLNAFADGGMQAPEQRGGTSSVLLDTGVAWIVGRNTQIDGSVGWGAHGTTPPRVFWSAGVSHRF
jgi:Putative MetA-pathway of phenol degradation